MRRWAENRDKTRTWKGTNITQETMKHKCRLKKTQRYQRRTNSRVNSTQLELKSSPKAEERIRRLKTLGQRPRTMTQTSCTHCHLIYKLNCNYLPLLVRLRVIVVRVKVQLFRDKFPPTRQPVQLSYFGHCSYLWSVNKCQKFNTTTRQPPIFPCHEEVAMLYLLWCNWAVEVYCTL